MNTVREAQYVDPVTACWLLAPPDAGCARRKAKLGGLLSGVTISKKSSFYLSSVAQPKKQLAEPWLLTHQCAALGGPFLTDEHFDAHSSHI